MRSEYFLAKFNGETFRGLKSGSQHNVVIRRRLWRGYTVGVCRGYEMIELTEYRKQYGSLAALLGEWEILEYLESDILPDQFRPGEAG